MNKHIEEYLDYYCELEYPSYAVLLKGQWGCGKSHFISEYQNKHAEGKFIYVSLYGLSSTTQINDEIFRKTSPILGSKSASVAAKIFTKTLKGLTKVDIEGNGEYITETLTRIEESILIFDDLERCEIGIQELLGYINSFVEHAGQKVIILADDKEVKDEEYLAVKEKLIGQELEIQLDIKEALESFCAEVKNENCKVFLLGSIDNVRSTYIASKYNNLRTLRKVIQDFEYIYTTIPLEAQNKNDLLQDLLSTLLALSLEIRSGSLSEQDIGELFRVNLYLSGKEDSTDPLAEIREKYSLPYSPILGEELWQIFFSKGMFDKGKLEEAIFNSQYFDNFNQESWVRLWHSSKLSDENFETVKNELQEDLSSSKYKKVPVIKHIFGLYLWMSKNNLLEMDEEEILRYFKGYVNNLVKQQELEVIEGMWVEEESYASLGYTLRESPYFQQFCDYLNSQGAKLVEESYPTQAQELLELMVSDTRLFELKLVLNNIGDQRYLRVPILSYIESSSFIEALGNVEDIYLIRSVIRRRYKYKDFNKELLKELDWLKSLVPLFENEIQQREEKLSGYKYGIILNEAVILAIEEMEAAKSELSHD